MAMAVITTSFAIQSIFLASTAAAQTALVTAECSYAEWTFYKNLSPCQIWGNLQAACNPNAVVPKLDTSVNVNATYPSPTGANATACQCTVIAYNLMAGCSWCQANVYSNNWVTESQWRSGCTNYDSTGGLPIQASSLQNSIPPWALEFENGRAWQAFDASTIAAGTSLPTATYTATLPSGSNFGSASVFGTGFGSTPTDNSNVQSIVSNVAKSVGITVGVIGGISLIAGAIVLVVFMTRQRNRKAWYGPTAEFYRNGGQMGDNRASQLLLGGASQTSNPFKTPSPSAATTSFVITPYQPRSPSNPNDPTSYGQGYAPAQYQQPPMGQHEPNYGQAYPQYYDPNNSQPSSSNSGSPQPIPQI